MVIVDITRDIAPTQASLLFPASVDAGVVSRRHRTRKASHRASPDDSLTIYIEGDAAGPKNPAHPHPAIAHTRRHRTSGRGRFFAGNTAVVRDMQALPDVVSRQRNNVHSPHPESVIRTMKNCVRPWRPEIRTIASLTAFRGGSSPSPT
ncbi:hypothetical protein [Pandoraea sp. ISTKB]|uniref:hypothetical protein n=1 Tax=Pandoraea sp. ISTKB TaxID=1586708 RepID=UPI001112D23A|nr:hypothetical protein [Pandoraea sp. ISTKB]